MRSRTRKTDGKTIDERRKERQRAMRQELRNNLDPKYREPVPFWDTWNLYSIILAISGIVIVFIMGYFRRSFPSSVQEIVGFTGVGAAVLGMLGCLLTQFQTKKTRLKWLTRVITAFAVLLVIWIIRKNM